jgi:hypothetical protein
MSKCGFNFLFIVIYSFSLVKAAMNAARRFVNCTMMLTKRHNLFLMAKGGTKTIGHLSIAEG